MDAYQAITSLRAVRQFDLSRPIEDEALRRILQAGRMSGSSRDSQPWWFIVIRNEQRLQAVAQTGDYAQHVAGAAFAIALVFDPQFYRGEFDSGRAAQNMMLAAWNDGIGSCLASLHREEDCKAVLGVPSELRLQHIISFGYPLPVDQSSDVVQKRSRKPLGGIVMQESWSEAAKDK
ncbi:5,6-dimethylbenzimidazole synthase [Thermoflexales bacterium]|nr:5,6-dimethylbenzimidazole synthase [Thermoflexales bacterium]